MVKSESIKKQIIKKAKEYYVETVFEKKPSNKINYAGRVYDDHEITNLVDSALEFWLTSGHYTKKFEKSLQDFLQVKHSLFVNSGSSANLLAFMTLASNSLGDRRIKRGDEVITVACGFPTTVTPILQYGAVPVFVDVEVETANINIDCMRKALSPKTKAVMIAHTLGNVFNIKEVVTFCKENNLWLISDCCDALGSLYKGKSVESYGDISTSSFYPAHHITTGQGGAVHTNNHELYKIAKAIRDWGRDCVCDSGEDNKCKKRFLGQHGSMPRGYDHKYIYSEMGYNLAPTDLQASIGYAQICKLGKFVFQRVDNWKYLEKNLEAYKKDFVFQTQIIKSKPSWFGFLMTIKTPSQLPRYKIVDYLESKGIQTRMLFAGNLTKQPLFSNLIENIDYKIIGDLYYTDYIMNNSFWIGVYPGMKLEDLDFMIKTIKEFVDEHTH